MTSAPLGVLFIFPAKKIKAHGIRELLLFLKYNKFFCCSCKILCAVFADVEQVADTYTVLSLKVNTRFDNHKVARSENFVGFVANNRQLDIIKAYAVSRKLPP